MWLAADRERLARSAASRARQLLLERRPLGEGVARHRRLGRPFQEPVHDVDDERPLAQHRERVEQALDAVVARHELSPASDPGASLSLL